MALRDLVDSGLPNYHEPTDEPFTVPDDIPPALQAALLGRNAIRWAEDRFRLGFALGAGLSVELFLDLP